MAWFHSSFRSLSIFAAAVLVLGAGWLLSLSLPGGELQASAAKRVFVKDGALLSVNEALGTKRLLADTDVQILFDERGDQLLIGKGISDRQIERPGGTKLFLVKQDGSGLRQITDQPVQQAFLNQAGTKIYYLTEKEKSLYETPVGSDQPTLIKAKVLEARLSPDEQRLVYHKLRGR